MGSHIAYPPLHTAEHILTRLLHDRFPALSDFSTRLKSRKCVVSFSYSGVITEEDRQELEQALQDIALADLPVQECFLSRQEAEDVLPNMHQVPDEAEEIRVVRVGRVEAPVDERACIGVHVLSTVEIVRPRLPTLREEETENWRVTLVVG